MWHKHNTHRWMKENSVDLSVDESKEGWDHAGKFQHFAKEHDMLKVLPLCCEFPSNSRWRWSRKALLHGRRKLEQGAKTSRAQDRLTLQPFGVRVLQLAARKRRVQIWMHFSPVMDSARCNSHMQVLRLAFSEPARQHGSVWLMSLPQTCARPHQAVQRNSTCLAWKWRSTM